MLCSELLAICVSDYPFIKVHLVANQNLVDLRLSVFINGLHPDFHVVVGGLICQIKADYDPVRLPVKVLCDCPELLLTCGVPNFHIDILSVLREFRVNVGHTYSRH